MAKPKRTLADALQAAAKPKPATKTIPSRREMADANRGIFDRNYRIFMAAPQTSGITNRKKTLYLRASDGQLHTDATGRRIKDDQVSVVAGTFRRWLRG